MSSDPTAVQEHMLKLFDNTMALTFDRSGGKVLGMVSSEKETFPFETQTLTEGAVEGWLWNVRRRTTTDRPTDRPRLGGGERR